MWDFASGCMRTYLALAEKARHFDSLPEVAGGARGGLGARAGAGLGRRRHADTLKAESEALDALAERGYYNERLDQILVEVLLGVR